MSGFTSSAVRGASPGVSNIKGWSDASWAAPAIIGDGRSPADDVIWAYPLDGIWIVEARDVQCGAERVVSGLLLALAESHGGVVGHLSGVPADDDPVLDALAALGRYVDWWPGAPIMLATSDPEVPDAIRRRPFGDRLEFATSLLGGWARLHVPDLPRRATKRIPPHPVSGRMAERFGILTCQAWGAQRAAERAGRVLHHLTSRAVDVTQDEVEVVLDLHRGKVRVAVRTQAPVRESDPSSLELGRGTADADATGGLTAVWPMADGGTFTWTVVDA